MPPRHTQQPRDYERSQGVPCCGEMKSPPPVRQPAAFVLQVKKTEPLGASAAAPPRGISRKTHFRMDSARARCTFRGMDHADQHDLTHLRCRAVLSWLRCQRLMAVSIHQQPVAPFSPKMAS
jgi:hypothetical protein